MKKIVETILLAYLCLFMVTGCDTYKKIDFEVQTEDKISIQLRTNDKYDVTKNLPFIITKEEETISQGTFITLEEYNLYVEAAKSNENITIIAEKEKDNLEYVFYSHNDSEYNYIIKIKNSNTGILLVNTVSQESEEACFKELKISKKS
ncbi:MAG: hypothetical protein PUB18_01290 [bacterium]|nr:hypothetical protein [bacterium]